MADTRDTMILSVPEDLKRRFQERFGRGSVSRHVRAAMTAMLDRGLNPELPEFGSSPDSLSQLLRKLGCRRIIEDYRIADFTAVLDEARYLEIYAQDLSTFCSLNGGQLARRVSSIEKRTEVFVAVEEHDKGSGSPQIPASQAYQVSQLLAGVEQLARADEHGTFIVRAAHQPVRLPELMIVTEDVHIVSCWGTIVALEWAIDDMPAPALNATYLIGEALKGGDDLLTVYRKVV